MGASGTKHDTAEKHYIDLAVDFKGQLDNLEICANALVQTAEGQTNLVKALLDADTRRPSPTEGGQNDKQGNRNANRSNEQKEKNDAGKNLTSLSSRKKPKKTTQESPAIVHGQFSSNNKNSYAQNEYHVNSPKFSSQEACETDVDMVDAMETGSNEFNMGSVVGHSETTVDTIQNRKLLGVLGNMQKSTFSQANAVLHSIRLLKAKIPAEISKQQQERYSSPVNTEKLQLQIKVLEGSYAKTVNPILCRDVETQVDSMSKAMEEEKRKLKEDLERFKRMHTTSQKRIKGLEQELAVKNTQQAQADGTGYSLFGNRWTKPAPPPRHKAMVQIYCRSRNEKLDAVNRELESLLTTQFDTINYDLECKSCDSKEQLNSTIPVIVLCINASRIGTDVATALEGLDRSSNMVVVILHHKDTHALPKQPSLRLLTGPEYKSLGGLIDMAFLSTKGVYPCDMNQIALTHLLSFIKGE